MAHLWKLVTVLVLTVGPVVDSVHVRNISNYCGKRPPAPSIIGGSAPALVLRFEQGAYDKPCYVRQIVQTDAGYIRNGARLYAKLVRLDIPKRANGSCYHSLTIGELSPEDGEDALFCEQLCGSLPNLTKDSFVSTTHEFVVVWDSREDSDPDLTQLSRKTSKFMMVITAFEDLDPGTKECPAIGEANRPETLIKWHKCKNDRCIDQGLRCDGFNNCGDDDASDELNCPEDADDVTTVPIIVGVVSAGVLLLVVIGVIFYRIGRDDDGDEESGQ